jgi:uncharacterized repeat protein (TIGR01451 family)
MKKLITKGFYFITVFSLVVWSTGLVPITHSLAVQPDDVGRKTTICHVKPNGTQETLEVDEHALTGHFDASGNPLHAGDTMGACPPPPPPPDCQLEVKKSDEGYDPIMPGEEIVYHLTIQNIGTDECTGDEGVFLKDFYDENTSYDSATIEPDRVTDDYIKWGVGILQPGEMIEVDLTMEVDEEVECDSRLENKALWWLSNQNYLPDNEWVTEYTTVECEEEDEESTIYAHKIICENESDLPNWSGNGPNITSTTALDYVDQNPNCELVEDWDFQWVIGTGGYAGDFIGPAPDWNSFDTSSAGITPAMKTFTEDDINGNDIIKIRENLKEGYIPFSFDPNGSDPPPGDDFTAELWCHTDVLNYDNYDFVRGFEMDQEYYCVAFNVLEETEEPEECLDEDNLIINHSFEEPEVTNNSLWQKMASVLGWVIEKVSDDSTTTLELHRGWSGNIAADGWQYAELDGDHSTRVHQDVTTEEGAEYKLFWSFAPRHNIGAEQNHLSVMVDGSQIATNGPATGNAPLAQDDWTQSNYTFTADSTNTNIALEDIGPSDSYGTYVDNVRLCKIADPETGYDPYCGDGEINQEWEQCDSDLPGCSQHCQYVVPECSDLVVAKINMEDYINFDPASDMSDDIYLGSDSYVIPNNVWIALYWNGNAYLDPDISGYEDVPGLAVQRSADGLRVVMYGTHPGQDKEHVSGNIEFYNATVTGQVSDNSNDYPGNNRLENGFDGTGVGNYNAGNDEVWTEDGNDTQSFFWLTTTTADDGYYTEWEIIEDCKNNICGMKFYDADQNGEYDGDDYNIAGWGISMAEKLMCEEGDEWADTVVDFDQGLRNDGSPVVPDRSDPNNALGVAEDNDTINFVSLGFGGTLILGFDNLIENGDGNDVEVIETSYGSPSCDGYPEYVQVYASQDGNTWEDIGNTCLDGTFDLGSLDWAKYIKLVDTTDPNDFGGQVDGYDVDGVRAIHCYNIAEENYETETGEDGYCFSDVPDGYYHVCEEIRDDWTNTTPICQQVMIENGQDAEINFGNYQEIIEEPYCGDGVVNQDSEQCDDGNNEDGDGCSAICLIEEEPPLLGNLTICKQEDLNGDGILDDGEPVVPNWTFRIGDNEYLAENGCVFIDLPYDTYNVSEEMQADWYQTGGEGNGVLETDGTITTTIDGEMTNPIIYFLNEYREPVEPFCGDGYVNQSSEQCDDGNTSNGDGCSSQCTTEGGGGGGGSWTYGMGNRTPDPYCGDGQINQALEQCDDNNISNGDGCSAICLVEEVLGVKIEPKPEVLGFKELPATGGGELPNTSQTYNWLLLISGLAIILTAGTIQVLQKKN